MIQHAPAAATPMQWYSAPATIGRWLGGALDTLAVWLLLSCCHSAVVLTYELLSDVAGIQDDPECTGCNDADAVVHSAVRFLGGV